MNYLLSLVPAVKVYSENEDAKDVHQPQFQEALDNCVARKEVGNRNCCQRNNGWPEVYLESWVTTKSKDGSPNSPDVWTFNLGLAVGISVGFQLIPQHPKRQVLAFFPVFFKIVKLLLIRLP